MHQVQECVCDVESLVPTCGGQVTMLTPEQVGLLAGWAATAGLFKTLEATRL
ncbi:MAG TPA: hypothetical protein VKC61_25350 [Pyrinomonadaceae bacterium]|nr:hypothetical protein [Pyrinomonadaceae bacterium]